MGVRGIFNSIHVLITSNSKRTTIAIVNVPRYCSYNMDSIVGKIVYQTSCTVLGYVRPWVKVLCTTFTHAHPPTENQHWGSANPSLSSHTCLQLPWRIRSE